jgi:hypothetical protein
VQAEAFGSMASGLGHSEHALFDDVYAKIPARLVEQRQELSAEAAEPAAATSILNFEKGERRAAG